MQIAVMQSKNICFPRVQSEKQDCTTMIIKSMKTDEEEIRSQDVQQTTNVSFRVNIYRKRQEN